MRNRNTNITLEGCGTNICTTKVFTRHSFVSSFTREDRVYGFIGDITTKIVIKTSGTPRSQNAEKIKV